MKPSTSLDVTLPTYEQARVHSFSTASAGSEVPSAPPKEPRTSPDSSQPSYEQARVHSLSTISANIELPDGPPEYEEVDTTTSGRIIQTTESFIRQNRFHEQRKNEIQRTVREPSTTIIEQPTPIACESRCNVSCGHCDGHDGCRKCKEKEAEESAKLCVDIFMCIFAIASGVAHASKS